jgi:hypothetical protein
LNAVGGKWRWWGNVSALTLALALEKLEHKESYSGNKGIVRSFPTSKSMTINATVNQLDTDALAEQLYGQVSTIASGAVVGEILPTVLVGDTVKLEFASVTALTIVDSTGTPVTLGAANYVLDPRFGSIDITTIPGGLVQPFKASYTRGAGKQVNMFTQAQPIVEFRYEGINLAENNAPVIVNVYRMSTDPLKELALINNDTKLSEGTITLNGLIDSTKPAAGSLGQFGRIVQMATA